MKLHEFGDEPLNMVGLTNPFGSSYQCKHCLLMVYVQKGSTLENTLEKHYRGIYDSRKIVYEDCDVQVIYYLSIS